MTEHSQTMRESVSRHHDVRVATFSIASRPFMSSDFLFIAAAGSSQDLLASRLLPIPVGTLHKQDGVGLGIERRSHNFIPMT